jgi:hypothetical protein
MLASFLNYTFYFSFAINPVNSKRFTIKLSAYVILPHVRFLWAEFWIQFCFYFLFLLQIYVNSLILFSFYFICAIRWTLFFGRRSILFTSTFKMIETRNFAVSLSLFPNYISDMKTIANTEKQITHTSKLNSLNDIVIFQSYCLVWYVTSRKCCAFRILWIYHI